MAYRSNSGVRQVHFRVPCEPCLRTCCTPRGRCAGALGGVYGVLSYGVERRTREFGMRMALGARPADLLRLVIGQALKLSGVGLAVAIAITHTMASILFGLALLSVASVGGFVRFSCWWQSRWLGPGLARDASRSGSGAAQRVKQGPAYGHQTAERVPG